MSCTNCNGVVAFVSGPFAGLCVACARIENARVRERDAMVAMLDRIAACPEVEFDPKQEENVADGVESAIESLQGERDEALAKLAAQLLDAAHISPRLSLWAMLADTDEVPLILGWSGCLDRAKLLMDAPHHRATLDF